ncbi:hypothetical protein BWI15_32470 [Kribbella sp. ALI-6-A]|uniref:hypothetical protein n=1 Tax=Kribbella sp. ALI-6-A TaxID=1933817 RepID=UPI00097BB147|nr:hypothetical protein [Kribbella sp. ALI-6-A]ONI67800.1 hypothetical protein BWI15_32470 [Kribbella sp. ALI-6-A]
MKLYRPVTVAVGVLFVLLGGLTRLLQPDSVYEDPTRIITRGAIGEDVRYFDSTVTVTRMRFAKSFAENKDDSPRVDTEGVFVAVEYDAVRGTKNPGNNDVTLTADDGSVYKPVTEIIEASITFAEPGFARSGALVFEVNPSDVVGLTLDVHTTSFFNVLNQDLAIDLGVPDEEIAQRSIEQAEDQYVIPDSVTRVA